MIYCDSESKFKILFAQKTQTFVIFSVALNDSNFTMAEQFCLFRFSVLTCSAWVVMLTPMQDAISQLGSKEVQILTIDSKNQAKYQYKAMNGKTDISKICR